jgi:hypothetical protein
MSIVSVDNIQPIGSGTSVTVNSAATLILNNVNSTGVVTATSFVGSGANLTSLPSQVTISNNADNRIITGGSGTNLVGESLLTFDGNVLLVASNSYNILEMRADENNDGGNDDNILKFTHDGTFRSEMRYDESSSTLELSTSDNRGDLVIASDGKIGISEGSPSNQLHVSGTTGTSAGGLLRLDATTGDNFILFDNTNDNTEWAVGYDSTTRGKFDIWYDDNSSGYDLKFSVDGATGAVRKPKNPVFMAYRTSYYNTTTSATVLVFDNEKIDVGGNYNVSNGRFTAPVTGLYEFGYASIASNAATTYRYDIRINGSIPYGGLRQELRIDQSNNSAQYGTNGEFCCYLNMTAGQYAEIYVSSDTNVTANGGAYGDTSYGYTYFRGRLIG